MASAFDPTAYFQSQFDILRKQAANCARSVRSRGLIVAFSAGCVALEGVHPGGILSLVLTRNTIQYSLVLVSHRGRHDSSNVSV